MKNCPMCGAPGYADGGEIPDAPLGRKREADLPAIDDPDTQLDVYRGEDARERKEQADAAKRDAELAAALRRRKPRRM